VGPVYFAVRLVDCETALGLLNRQVAAQYIQITEAQFIVPIMLVRNFGRTSANDF